MQKAIVFTALAGIVLTFAGNRPERKPGNLTPVQLISALGAWALVLANISALALAIHLRSLTLGCSVMATFAIALTLFVRDDVTRMVERETPGPVKAVIDDIKQLLGGAPRLGMDSLETVVVAGRCPGIGVAVMRQGRVVVRVRQDVVRWLEGHQQAGGAGAAVVASFVRFTVLHELAHVLNGDHRTFRFVRSVLIAHLVWIAGAVSAAASLVADRNASAGPLVVSASILVLFVAQSLVARRFIAERERQADWRAMQTLAPADAARLLERGGRRRAAQNPTELEKLMIDLKAHSPMDAGGRMFSRLILLVWPQGDDIHQRAEMAGSDRADRAPQPVWWAALMGMQSGLFSMALVLAAMFAVSPWIGWRREVSEMVTMLIAMGVNGPAATFCGLRVDPGRMSVRTINRRGLRFAVGIAFFFAFAVASLVLYRFQVGFGMFPLISALHFAVILAMVAFIAGLCVWGAGLIGNFDGGGELRNTPHSPRVLHYPVIVGFGLVPLLSVAVTYWLAIGSFRSGHWFALTAISIAAFTVSTSMARSTNPVLRRVAPMALLETPAPVYGFRVFWRDFYVDLSRMRLARATALAVAVQIAAMPFFVILIGLLMRRVRAVLTADLTYSIFFYGTFGVMALILIIPDRHGVFSDAWMRLADTNRLQVFEKLLAVSRIVDPQRAEQLRSALSRWIRNERLPAALAPDPNAVWPLAPLLSLVRLARATGDAALLERWRDRLTQSLRRIISNDAVAVAPGQPPSLYWTALAATIIDEAELRDAFPFERILDRVESLLVERLKQGTINLLADVVSAGRLLRRHGRPDPNPQSMRRLARSSTIVFRPLLRQSLFELCELAELTGDADLREKLGPIVRSRSWEVLQLNPRKDVLLLLDCYLAAAYLGEMDSYQSAAAVIAGELAQRTTEELMAIVNR